MEVFFSSIIYLIILALILGILYRYRYEIKRFLKDREYPRYWEQDGVKMAERSVIKAQWKLEDAKDYLDFKVKKQAEKDAEETKEE